MSLSLDVVLRAAAIGVGANVMMDLWNLALRRVAGVRSLDFALLGRWILHMPSGTFAHGNIGKAAPRKGERVVGWAAHDAIRVTFAVGFVAIVSAAWLARPTVLPALLYGVATVVFPYFLMQPALGLGIAAAKTPQPAQARLKSLGTHAVFGLGLWLCALVLRAIAPMA
ncbi:MAG: DUF2938 domain-containing protein [Planctomycetota bacterium]